MNLPGVADIATVLSVGGDTEGKDCWQCHKGVLYSILAYCVTQRSFKHDCSQSCVNHTPSDSRTPAAVLPSTSCSEKESKAALRKSPSLRNTFKPITQNSPGLMCTWTALLRMQLGMEGQESKSSTQEAEKTKSASLPAYTPQTTKLKQKP